MKLRHLVTRPHPAVVGSVFVALAAHALYRGHGAVGVLGGLLLWTLLEYAAHRWLLHGFTGRTYDFLHGGHHRDPRNVRRALVPLVHSLIIAGVLHAAAVALDLWSVLGGLLVGYLAFEATHAALHADGVRRYMPRGLRRHHARHHYVDERAAFGVTTTLWDRVFRTMPTAPHPFAVCDGSGNGESADAV